MSATYNLIITEQQRRIITASLEASATDNAIHDNTTTEGPYGTDLTEATILGSMFEELPQEESSHPGIVHGLAL